MPAKAGISGREDAAGDAALQSGRAYRRRDPSLRWDDGLARAFAAFGTPERDTSCQRRLASQDEKTPREMQRCKAAEPSPAEIPAFSLRLKFILSAAAGGVEGLG